MTVEVWVEGSDIGASQNLGSRFRDLCFGLRLGLRGLWCRGYLGDKGESDGKEHGTRHGHWAYSVIYRHQGFRK